MAGKTTGSIIPGNIFECTESVCANAAEGILQNIIEIHKTVKTAFIREILYIKKAHQDYKEH
jgi:hypothetical protein